MIEMDIQKKEDAFEHGEKAYEELGKMLDCLEEMCKGGSMGERMGYRDDDEWYIRRLRQDQERERMAYRQGVKGTGPYSRYSRRMGYRDDYRDPMYD